MKRFFDDFKKVRIYALVCLIGYAVFLWVTISNYRIWGDDNQAKEQAATRGFTRSNNFYHK